MGNYCCWNYQLQMLPRLQWTLMMLLLVSRQIQMDTLLHQDEGCSCSVAMIRIDSMACVHSIHLDSRTLHCWIKIVKLEHIYLVDSGVAEKVAV